MSKISSVNEARRERISAANDPVAGSVILARRIKMLSSYAPVPMAREMSIQELHNISDTLFYAIPSDEDRTVIRACNEIYMHGFADEQSGDMEAPTGHFYRVARWVVETDSAGFDFLTEFDTEIKAQDFFHALDLEFSAWDSEENES